MKLFKLLFGFALLALILSASNSAETYSKKVPSDKSPEGMRSTIALKKYMGEFGSLVAGMEIMKYKEQKPDWEAIEITLKQMRGTLEAMKKADSTGNYKEFTQALDQNLKEVEAYGKAKNKKVFESFENLTNTCFKCHAAHRPSDFLVPQKKDPRISQRRISPLFQGPGPIL